MSKIILSELMKAPALSKEKKFYLNSIDDQIAFEVPVNTVHSGLDIKSTGEISVPMKAVKRLFDLASQDVESLCARQALSGGTKGRGPKKWELYT